MKFAHLLASIWWLAAGTGATAAAATLDALDADGVYTWRVAAPDDAPPWCCYSWNSGSAAVRSCDLDGRNSNYGTSDRGGPVASGEMQMYATVEAGRSTRIRALSPQCEVRSKRDITDLGEVDVAESVGWLEPRVAARSDVSEDALAAIAVHRGAGALRYLVHTADNGPTKELRKEAIFWMSQTRIGEAAGDIERLMFKDDDGEIRQHAAFAMAQSQAPARDEYLLRQGQEDRDAEVRSQAWFWLAQTGAPGSEKAIRRAMVDDRDSHVREEAVFALSQLPGERAVDVLFEVLEDRQLPTEVRKQALFWLVQSDSDRAYDYLDRLFAGRN